MSQRKRDKTEVTINQPIGAHPEKVFQTFRDELKRMPLLDRFEKNMLEIMILRNSFPIERFRSKGEARSLAREKAPFSPMAKYVYDHRVSHKPE
jgi:hypothetical protein